MKNRIAFGDVSCPLSMEALGCAVGLLSQESLDTSCRERDVRVG